MKTLMIYGAMGYTWRLVAEYAKAAGVTFILGGRDRAKHLVGHELTAQYPGQVTYMTAYAY